MSLRPIEGRQPPERGGDGPRRRWSESPVPRVGTRRVMTAGTSTPSSRIDTVLTVEFGPDSYPFGMTSAMIFSPDDGFDDTTGYYWGVKDWDGSALFYWQVGSTPIPLSWTVFGSPSPVPDLTVTDPDWFLLTHVGGAEYAYSEPPQLQAASLTILGVTYVGVYSNVGGSQGFLFPTLSVPFVIGNAYP